MKHKRDLIPGYESCFNATEWLYLAAIILLVLSADSIAETVSTFLSKLF
jgi:hypothetical protein